jgi:hypothetical protein
VIFLFTNEAPVTERWLSQPADLPAATPVFYKIVFGAQIGSMFFRDESGDGSRETKIRAIATCGNHVARFSLAA